MFNPMRSSETVQDEKWTLYSSTFYVNDSVYKNKYNFFFSPYLQQYQLSYIKLPYPIFSFIINQIFS